MIFVSNLSALWLYSLYLISPFSISDLYFMLLTPIKVWACIENRLNKSIGFYIHTYISLFCPWPVNFYKYSLYVIPECGTMQWAIKAPFPMRTVTLSGAVLILVFSVTPSMIVRQLLILPHHSGKSHWGGSVWVFHDKKTLQYWFIG